MSREEWLARLERRGIPFTIIDKSDEPTPWWLRPGEPCSACGRTDAHVAIVVEPDLRVWDILIHAPGPVLCVECARKQGVLE